MGHHVLMAGSGAPTAPRPGCVTIVSAETQEATFLPADVLTSTHHSGQPDGRGQIRLDSAAVDALMSDLRTALNRLVGYGRAALQDAIEMVDYARATGTGIGGDRPFRRHISADTAQG